jgi:hypothetical protein
MDEVMSFAGTIRIIILGIAVTFYYLLNHVGDFPLHF